MRSKAATAVPDECFAIEHSDVEPDLVTVAKSLAGGLPLAGVVGRAAIMDAVEPGGLGGTYGGLAAQLCSRAGGARCDTG